MDPVPDLIHIFKIVEVPGIEPAMIIIIIITIIVLIILIIIIMILIT